MKDEVRDQPLSNVSSFVKGFVSGGLIGLGILSPYDPIARIILLILGAVIFIDAIIPYKDLPYRVTVIISLAIGFVATSVVNFYDAALFYFVFIIVVAGLVYFYQHSRSG